MISHGRRVEGPLRLVEVRIDKPAEKTVQAKGKTGEEGIVPSRNTVGSSLPGCRADVFSVITGSGFRGAPAQLVAPQTVLRYRGSPEFQAGAAAFAQKANAGPHHQIVGAQ